MHSIATDDAPSASGHYSQAIVANGFVFISGQLPMVPATRAVPEGATAQTRQAIANLEAILRASGSGLEHVVSTTVYVTDIAHWPEVNAVYADLFGGHRPARAVAVSPQLHFGCLVEIQGVALVPPARP
jgi:2-iminobutanoate/2-iminopropanoate deaminase